MNALENRGEERKERIYSLDIARGISIVLVVLGHCIQCGSGRDYYETLSFLDNPIYKFIYSFHMILFAVVSGFLFEKTTKKYTSKEVLGRRIFSLLLPIISWNFVFSIKNFFSMTLGEWFFCYIQSCLNSFWFLWAILFSTVIVWLLDRVKNKIFYIGFILVLLWLIPDWGNLGPIKFLFFGYLVGFFVGKSGYESKMKNGMIVVLVALFYFLLLRYYDRDSYIYVSGWCILNDRNQIQLKVFLLDIYREVIGLLGSYVVVFVSIIIDKRKDSYLRNNLCFLGQNSMGIYVVSTYFNILLYRIEPMWNVALGWIIESIFVIISSIVVVGVIKKSNILSLLFLGIIRKEVKTL